MKHVLLPPQDDPSGEAVSPLVLSPQPSAFHPLLAVDLPVYVLQVWMPYNSLALLVRLSEASGFLRLVLLR